MKKVLMILCVALLGGAAMYAQEIAVVSSDGETNVYQTLDEAITSASPGCVIYLPGGGFRIKDDTKITNRVTIIGVGHKVNENNVEGSTMVSGNLHFDNGSDGSSVMGIYLSGSVKIGVGTEDVTNILLRYCNISSLNIAKSSCTGTYVNQCYIRSTSDCNGAPVTVTNSIFHSWCNTSGSTFDHNVVTSYYLYQYGAYIKYYHAFRDVSNSTISNNILLDPGNDLHSGSNCQIFNNMLTRKWGNNCILVSTSMANALVNIGPGVSTESDFHLSGEDGKNAATDGTDVGIYGGPNGALNFNDDTYPPIPRIISKEISDQTGVTGLLKIRIAVKAK